LESRPRVQPLVSHLYSEGHDYWPILYHIFLRVVTYILFALVLKVTHCCRSFTFIQSRFDPGGREMRTAQPRISTVIFILMMAGMIFPLYAQSGRSPAGTVTAPAEEVILKTRSAPFTIPVTTIDEDGHPVSRLARRDFHLYENGVEQEIVRFVSTEEPFQIALLIDTSRSTLTKLKDMQEAAIEFVEQLRPQDRVMIVSFDDEVYVDTEMTDNRDEWRRAIRGTRVGRGARLFDAIDLTITERLSRLEGRKAIVLLTDGVDSASHHATARSTIARAEVGK
jgi:von Willebrand factor type A domain